MADFCLFFVHLYEIPYFMYEIAAYWKFPNAACKDNVNYADFQIVARLVEVNYASIRFLVISFVQDE